MSKAANNIMLQTSLLAARLFPGGKLHISYIRAHLCAFRSFNIPIFHLFSIPACNSS